MREFHNQRFISSLHFTCYKLFYTSSYKSYKHFRFWTLFYYQLMHITLKNAELLKHSKVDKNAPTCFGLHRNHLQGAKFSAWLKFTPLVNSICVKDVPQILLTKRVIFSQALTLAPLRWFLCKPKHVGAFLSTLECFNNSAFFNVMCISW